MSVWWGVVTIMIGLREWRYDWSKSVKWGGGGIKWGSVGGIPRGVSTGSECVSVEVQ